ncbi:MAG: tRNA (N6-isopentenyl adenosine(37)-C2)-methylthiotransferase MiaB [Nitrospiraceae bacterium]|nr:MAG: tRNA (N6-isopentenyl adenosine(37)-C2)-methylthiotransferase MiaB [Nitrospiraceae bacterium]
MDRKTKKNNNFGKRFYLHTFGCQMNVHDSEKMAGILSEAGMSHSNHFNNADVIVLNTCSIREKAEQKFYSELGRLETVKKNNPKLKIAVAGCIAQQKGDALLKRFPYVDFIFGPDNINNLETWINFSAQDTGERLKKTALAYNPEYHFMELPVKREEGVRAWVSIMYGCDNFCAYCIVPYTRGRERSRPARDIYREVSALASQGYREVTLLGQNVNSYGKNMPENIDFSDLLCMIHEIEDMKRIRFVTSHPRDLSEKLVNTMNKLPKMCNHLHLPLQSGSDKILFQMNRGYSYREYKDKIMMLRNALPESAITTDIIVGFPGEKEEDFQATMDALKEMEFDGIFAFKYSPRPNTSAVDLPGHIDEKAKSRRLSEVLDLQSDITYRKNKKFEGSTVEVLVEGYSDTDKDKLTGRTGSNKIVNFHGSDNNIGKFVAINITEAKQHSLYGILIHSFSVS